MLLQGAAVKCQMLLKTSDIIMSSWPRVVLWDLVLFIRAVNSHAIFHVSFFRAADSYTKTANKENDFFTV